jgi:adenylyltransferase/sulfurtransferase
MTPDQKERYSRQIRFAELGESGQERLLASHVAILGCGALGTFQAGALARAGIGKLTLVDRDYVELSNLQRQWLFEEADVEKGTPKAAAAAASLGRINSGCVVEPVVADLVSSNIEELLEGVDLILDGTDNFEARYLINDYAVSRGVPWIYGGAVSSYGITMPILPPESPCFVCVYPRPPVGAQQTCETSGVLNPVIALVAAVQVGDALKILSAGPGSVRRRITTFDVWSGNVRQVQQPSKDPQCSVCGRGQFRYLNQRTRVPVSLCGRNAVQIHERARPLDLSELSARLRSAGDVKANEFALRFFIPPYEMTIFPDGRAIIKGTTEVGVARSLYARYIGS